MRASGLLTCLKGRSCHSDQISERQNSYAAETVALGLGVSTGARAERK